VFSVKYELGFCILERKAEKWQHILQADGYSKACSCWSTDQYRALLDVIKTFVYSEYIKCATLAGGQTSGLMGPEDGTFKSSSGCESLLVSILTHCRQVKSVEQRALEIWRFVTTKTAQVTEVTVLISRGQ
jgi:hypothetical protein